MELRAQEEGTSARKVTLTQPSYQDKGAVSNKWRLMDLGNDIGLMKVVEQLGRGIISTYLLNCFYALRLPLTVRHVNYTLFRKEWDA
jgi:hypothetical protein